MGCGSGKVSFDEVRWGFVLAIIGYGVCMSIPFTREQSRELLRQGESPGRDSQGVGLSTAFPITQWCCSEASTTRPRWRLDVRPTFNRFTGAAVTRESASPVVGNKFPPLRQILQQTEQVKGHIYEPISARILPMSIFNIFYYRRLFKILFF